MIKPGVPQAVVAMFQPRAMLQQAIVVLHIKPML